MEEIWKIIDDYDNYKISNLGNLKSKSKRIKKCINRDGYYQVSLYKNGNKKSILVHRLVAMTFIPNPLNKPTVNHIDGNKLNNNVSNLEWATCKEQQYHSRNVLGHNTIISDKCRKKQIELHQRKVKRSDGIAFNSIKEASNGNETLRKHINDVCLGKRKQAGGYGWQYI